VGKAGKGKNGLVLSLDGDVKVFFFIDRRRVNGKKG
jgi:hypothetical protein